MKITTPRLISNPFYLLFFVVFFTLSGCKKEQTNFISSKITKEYNSEVIQQWNHVFVDLERPSTKNKQINLNNSTLSCNYHHFSDLLR